MNTVFFVSLSFLALAAALFLLALGGAISSVSQAASPLGAALVGLLRSRAGSRTPRPRRPGRSATEEEGGTFIQAPGDGDGGGWDGECSPGSPCPTPLAREEIGCADRNRATDDKLTLRDSVLIRGPHDGVVH